MTILQRLYSIYCALVFLIGFILLLPVFLILIVVKPFRHYTGMVNYIWAHFFFRLIFLPFKAKYHRNYKYSDQYIFCPNHFSYLDIPIMGFTRNDFVFVGKSEIAGVPLFGYMFRKLHITVNRENFRDRYSVVNRSSEALDKGHSLVIFPEGGIVTDEPPNMTRFKDGAFRLAIEKQIPIIPVTIPFNWIVLPDDGSYLPKLRRVEIFYHDPIETAGKTMDDLETLKEQTREVIQDQLTKSLSL